MKAYLYKFMPLLILVIGLIVLYVINDYPILLHVIVIIAFITSGLKMYILLIIILEIILYG